MAPDSDPVREPPADVAMPEDSRPQRVEDPLVHGARDGRAGRGRYLVSNWVWAVLVLIILGLVIWGWGWNFAG